MPLIVLEGIDGCGKTTQVELLCRRLDAEGVAHRRLREPGGTALGERVRSLLLDPATQAGPVAELFGYLTARAQLCAEVLAPALAAGEVVVLDRFFHSTVAYQGYGLGLDLARVRAAIDLAIGGLRIDRALWLAVDPAEAQRRRAASRPDRIEARGIAYLARVHAGFAALAEAGELERLDATLPVEALAQEVWARVAPVVAAR